MNEPLTVNPIKHQWGKPFLPLISVVLPVYQGESSILNAVHSVLTQTYPHLELIVVDDGSTDDTLKRLATVQDPRLKVLTQPNMGSAMARNNGLSHSQGEYVAFIDADDIWFPTKLDSELDVIQRQPNPICIVYSWYYGVDESNRLINLSPPYQFSGYIFDEVLHKESVLIPSTSLYHRKVFETLGGFPSNRYHEDRVFSVRACKYFPAYPTKQRLVIYRQSITGKCRSVLRDYELAFRSAIMVAESLRGVLSPVEVEKLTAIETRNLFYRFLMYNFFDSAKRLYKLLDPTVLPLDKKGILSRLSMMSGINLLFYGRQLVQFCTKYLLMPWWRLTAVGIYQKT